MQLRSLVFYTLFVLGVVSVSLAPSDASAQGGPVDAAPSVAPAAPPATPAVPPPAAEPTRQAPERPVRGPSVRERGGRRSRGASAASGALMITIIVGALAYYVIKRIRR